MSSSQLESKGFFASLFDFSFTSFITLRFLRVIYIVLMIVIFITALVLFFTGFTRGGAGIAFSLIVVPIVTLLYLVIARIYMELIAIFFRIGENTTQMAAALGGGTGFGGGGQAPAPYGYDPQGPPPPSYGAGPQAPPPSTTDEGPYGPPPTDPTR